MSSSSPSHLPRGRDTPEPESEQSYEQMSRSSATAADPFQAGVHCAYCSQLDFLPFRCLSCDAQFCLSHRTESAHDCPKAGSWSAVRRARNGVSPNSNHLASSSPSSQPAASKKPSILTHEAQCARPDCKTLVDTPLVQGITCDRCRRRYCLKHRMGEEHSCDKLEPLGIGGGSGKSDRGLGDALSRLRAWGAQKKAAVSSTSTHASIAAGGAVVPPKAAKITAPLDRTETAQSTTSGSSNNSKSAGHAALQRIISPFTTAAARSSGSKSKGGTATSSGQIVALNALKRTAKGDPKVPADRRLYLRLEAVGEGEGRAGAKIPRADAFFDRGWKVGRVLDSAARTLAIENVNNREIGEERRLRVYWIDGGRLLEFGETLGEARQPGQGVRAVQSGDTLVLLRGVGPLDG